MTSGSWAIRQECAHSGSWRLVKADVQRRGDRRCATLYRLASGVQRPEGATLTGLLAFIWL